MKGELEMEPLTGELLLSNNLYYLRDNKNLWWVVSYF